MLQSISATSNALVLLSYTAVFAFITTLVFSHLGFEKVSNSSNSFKWPLYLFIASIFSLFPYFILFENSYVNFSNEGDYTIPVLNYLATSHPGGVFSHSFSGGSDVYALTLSGQQYILPERTLLEFLPLWLVILIHKIGVYSIGFWGAYLLCYSLPGVSRQVASSIAILSIYLVFHQDETFGRVFGIYAVPMVVYLTVVKLEDKRHYFYLVAAAAITAMLPPIHDVPNVIIACVAVWIIVSRKKQMRFAISMIALISASIANWHELIYGMAQVSRFSEKGMSILTDPPWIQTVISGLLSVTSLTHNLAIVLGLSALIILLIRRHSFAKHAMQGLGAGMLLYVSCFIIPWQEIGLESVSRITKGNWSRFLLPVLLPIAAIGFSTIPMAEWQGKKYRGLHPVFICIALTASLIVSQRGTMVFNLIHAGGQAQYHSVRNLAKPDWLGNSPARTVTIGSGFIKPGVASGFYGLDSIDGKIQFAPKRLTEFVRMTSRDHKMGYYPQLSGDYTYFDWKSLGFNIADIGDIDLLRIANVGFVLSPFPLSGKGLKKVSGPVGLRKYYIAQSSRAEKIAYYRRRWKQALRPDDLFVYSTRPIPRVFTASRIVSMPDQADNQTYIELIKKHALQDGAVIRTTDANSLSTLKIGTFIVGGFQLVQDSVQVEVSAKESGLLMVNIPYLPFWRAWGDGKELKIVPANMIHMAIPILAGTKKVVLRYCRPLLRERLFNTLGVARSCPTRD